jgi:hypothetical protein
LEGRIGLGIGSWLGENGCGGGEVVGGGVKGRIMAHGNGICALLVPCLCFA